MPEIGPRGGWRAIIREGRDLVASGGARRQRRTPYATSARTIRQEDTVGIAAGPSSGGRGPEAHGLWQSSRIEVGNTGGRP